VVVKWLTAWIHTEDSAVVHDMLVYATLKITPTLCDVAIMLHRHSKYMSKDDHPSWVDQSKTVEVVLMQLSPYSSPIVVFAG